MDQSNEWLGLGVVFGILLAWFGFILILVSLPIASGRVKSSEYNYRPFRHLRRQWLGITDEVENRVNRQATK